MFSLLPKRTLFPFTGSCADSGPTICAVNEHGSWHGTVAMAPMPPTGRQQLQCKEIRTKFNKSFNIAALVNNIPFLTRVLSWARRNCSSHCSADCKIQACAILFFVACSESQSSTDCGQYSAASHIRGSTSCVKQGSPTGPPCVSVSSVSSLKNGAQSSVCFVTDANNMPMICVANLSSQRQSACIKCFVWCGLMPSLIC